MIDVQTKNLKDITLGTTGIDSVWLGDKKVWPEEPEFPEYNSSFSVLFINNDNTWPYSTEWRLTNPNGTIQTGTSYFTTHSSVYIENEWSDSLQSWHDIWGDPNAAASFIGKYGQWQSWSGNYKEIECLGYREYSGGPLNTISPSGSNNYNKYYFL